MNGLELKTKLVDILNELKIGISDFVDYYYSESDKESLALSVGEFKVVYSERSSEHDGWEQVFFFKDHNIYLELIDPYDSNNKVDWDYSEFTHVEPYQYTVTKYRKVK